MTYTRGEMKAARQLTGLSQRELGRLAGYSPSRIAALEATVVPPQVAAALDQALTARLQAA